MEIAALWLDSPTCYPKAAWGKRKSRWVSMTGDFAVHGTSQKFKKFKKFGANTRGLLNANPVPDLGVHPRVGYASFRKGAPSRKFAFVFCEDGCELRCLQAWLAAG
jgi:hypothetical protein